MGENNYSKLKEKVATVGIPIVTGGILSLLEIFGKSYLKPILMFGIGVILLFTILYFSFKFLEKREERWQEHEKKYDGLKDKIEGIEKEINHLKIFVKTNEKINKLEKSLGYILGSLRKNEK